MIHELVLLCFREHGFSVPLPRLFSWRACRSAPCAAQAIPTRVTASSGPGGRSAEMASTAARGVDYITGTPRTRTGRSQRTPTSAWRRLARGRFSCPATLGIGDGGKGAAVFDARGRADNRVRWLGLLFTLEIALERFMRLKLAGGGGAGGYRLRQLVAALNAMVTNRRHEWNLNDHHAPPAAACQPRVSDRNL